MATVFPNGGELFIHFSLMEDKLKFVEIVTEYL